MGGRVSATDRIGSSGGKRSSFALDTRGAKESGGPQASERLLLVRISARGH